MVPRMCARGQGYGRRFCFFGGRGLQWLGVTRARDPPLPLQVLKIFVVFYFGDMNLQWDGKLRCAKTSP